MNSGEPFEFVAGVEVAGVFVGRGFAPFDVLDFFDLGAAFSAKFVVASVVVRAVSATFGTDDDRAGVGRFRDTVFFEDRGFRTGLGVEPGNFDGVAPIVGRELEPNLAQRREGVEVVAGGFRDDFGREFQVASAVRHVGGMARYCDSDDFVDEDMYRAMYDSAIESNADTVLCDFYMCASGTNSEIKTITVSDDRVNTLKSYIGFGWTIISNMICKKSLYDSHSIASPLGITYCEDFSLTFRLLYHSEKIVQINRAFYYYWCENPNSAMAHRGEQSILDERKVYLDIIDMMQRDGVLDTYEREISWRILKNKQDLCLNKNSHKEFLSIFPRSHRHIATCPSTFCNRKIKIMMWLLSHKMSFVLSLVLALREWKLRIS